MLIIKCKMNDVSNKAFPSVTADYETHFKAFFTGVLVCSHLTLMVKQCILFFLLGLLHFLMFFFLFFKLVVMAILEHPFGFSLQILEFCTGYFGAWMCHLGTLTLRCQ